jgi:NAD(P)-dependent dehydrogenase (short-subunit alcohol dehydrogenase family)
MIRLDFQGAGVIVTGGTRGIGKAVGMEFARAGARVFLTHRWGTADEDELAAEFEAEGLPLPRVVESDASDPAATRQLMELVKESVERLDVVVSSVAFAKVINELSELRRSTMELSLRYSAWPVVDLVQSAREVLGCYPRYVVGISSDGPEVCHPGYDLIGVSKAVLETLCRYLALRLKAEGVRVNVLRPGFTDTDSARATFGDAVLEETGQRVRDILLDPRVVGRACVALCSGLMDGVTGQVIQVDEGWSLVSPITYCTGKGWPASFPEGAGQNQ